MRFEETMPSGALRGVALFRGLNDRQIVDLASLSHRVTLPAGRAYFRQGERARELFVLLCGRVRICCATSDGHQVVVRYVSSGEMFGICALVDSMDYCVTATAATASVALALEAVALKRLMWREPAIAINAVELLAQELAEIRCRFQELATDHVARRIARELVRLIRKMGTRVDAGVLLACPLSRQDMAELTGTTLHTVSRVFCDWERRGLVTCGRRRVVVRQPRGLDEIAGEGI